MSSLFTKIINRELPANIIAEDTENIAILDINPLKKGHALVIPKLEIDYIFKLSDTAYQNLFQFAKKVAVGIEKSITCTRIGVAVIGLEVPHVHIHLVPIDQINDLNFSNPKLSLTKDEMEAICHNIKNNLSQ